jgi:acyl-CoA thioesterase YciA
LKKLNLINMHPIKKSDLGFHGNLFGGKLMAWIDASAAAYAMEVCHNRRMVTICIDKCVFKKPAKEGSLLKIYGEVAKIGSTSITLYLEARSFNVYTHEEDVLLSTNITFVRIDEDGNSIPISDKVRERLTQELNSRP